MKIKKLIEKLKKMDQEAEAIGIDDTYGYYTIKGAEEIFNTTAEKYCNKRKIFIEIKLKKAILIV